MTVFKATAFNVDRRCNALRSSSRAKHSAPAITSEWPLSGNLAANLTGSARLRSIDPQARVHRELDGIHRQGEDDRRRGEQGYHGYRKRAHQHASGGERGDQEDIAE